MSRHGKGVRTGTPDSCMGVRVTTREGLAWLRSYKGIGPEWEGELAELADRIAACRARGLPGRGRSEHDGPSPWRLAKLRAGGVFELALALVVVAQALANVRELEAEPEPPLPLPPPAPRESDPADDFPLLSLAQ